MENNFKFIVLNFLKGYFIEYEEYGEDEITLNMVDINIELGNISWEELLQEYFNRYDYEIRFTYGDGNWVTVHRVN